MTTFELLNKWYCAKKQWVYTLYKDTNVVNISDATRKVRFSDLKIIMSMLRMYKAIVINPVLSVS